MPIFGKVLVTGANGFIGSQLCAALLPISVEVRGLVRSSGSLDFLHLLKDLKLYEGDITVPSTLVDAAKGVDLIYHVAALAADWGEWETFNSVNIDGVRNVMEEALRAKVKRVVHVSSVSVYGFPLANEITEDTSWVKRADDLYVTTKQQGEMVALSYHKKPIEVVVIRPAWVYGPNDRTTSLKLLPELEKKRLPYIDHGKHVLSPIYIDNLVDAMIMAGKNPNASGCAYNIVDENSVTWREFLGLFCDALKCEHPKRSVSSKLIWPVACMVEKAAKVIGMKKAPILTKYRARAAIDSYKYSCDRAKRELGYKPYVSTAEGIARTVAWYRSYMNNIL